MLLVTLSKVILLNRILILFWLNLNLVVVELVLQLLLLLQLSLDLLIHGSTLELVHHLLLLVVHVFYLLSNHWVLFLLSNSHGLRLDVKHALITLGHVLLLLLLQLSLIHI